MKRKQVLFDFFYWIFAFFPFALALFLLFHNPFFETPAYYLQQFAQNEVFILPVFHTLFAVFFFPYSNKMAKSLTEKYALQQKKTDLLDILPGLRLYLIFSLCAFSLSTLYRYHNFQSQSLNSRVFAILLALGFFLFSFGLSSAAKSNVLALHFSYTHKCQKVWGKTHKLAAPIFYFVGALLCLSAFLLDGWLLIFYSLSIFISVLLLLFFYARHLYRKGFYS